MNRLKRFLNNDWTITLVSTMIGIMLGLYINDFFANRNLIKAQKKALLQVRTELDDNESILKEYHDTLVAKYQGLNYIFQYVSEDLELLVPKDSLERLIKHTKSVFAFERFENIEANRVKVKGDLNLYISSPLMLRDLSHAIWDSYKQTDYLSVTKFKCMTSIEGYYDLQDEVNIVNNNWKEVFYEGTDFFADPALRNEYMKLLFKLLTKQELLLKYYAVKDEVFEECK